MFFMINPVGGRLVTPWSAPACPSILAVAGFLLSAGKKGPPQVRSHRDHQPGVAGQTSAAAPAGDPAVGSIAEPCAHGQTGGSAQPAEIHGDPSGFPVEFTMLQ